MVRSGVVRTGVAAALLCLLIAPLHANNTKKKTPKVSVETRNADQFQQKLDHVKENAAKQRPDPAPTIFREEEINAWFAQRRLKMPDGVKTVRFALNRDQVTADATVDFAELRRDRPTMNPLLSIFDGMHDAQVVAHTTSGEGTVLVRVESVTIDGIGVPRMMLKMFIDHFVQPKYPKVRLDGDYKLPARIDTAVIGERTGTVVQK